VGKRLGLLDATPSSVKQRERIVRRRQELGAISYRDLEQARFWTDNKLHNQLQVATPTAGVRRRFLRPGWSKETLANKKKLQQMT
jgi:hypothetical protein